jgi:hypothetical protein
VTEEEFVHYPKGKSKYDRDFIVVDIFKVLLHDEYVKLLTFYLMHVWTVYSGFSVSFVSVSGQWQLGL